jgi:hypothetical protein
LPAATDDVQDVQPPHALADVIEQPRARAQKHRRDVQPDLVGKASLDQTAPPDLSSFPSCRHIKP